HRRRRTDPTPPTDGEGARPDLATWPGVDQGQEMVVRHYRAGSQTDYFSGFASLFSLFGCCPPLRVFKARSRISSASLNLPSFISASNCCMISPTGDGSRPELCQSSTPVLTFWSF